MDVSILKEARKIGDKFEQQKIKKTIDLPKPSGGTSDSREGGRNISVMSKIKRKGEFEFKGKTRKIPEKKRTEYYVKRYKFNKPYAKEVNGVLEYAAYKIVKYYGTINPEIKIPKNIHLSFEEEHKQFTIASSVNFNSKDKATSGLRTMLYRQIANQNIFFFTLLGYADTHAGNIVATKENSYYLIDFDYAFRPFGDKLLSFWAPHIKVKEVKTSILKSYLFYKEVNIQKVRNIISSSFSKARKLLDSEVEKLSKTVYDDVMKELKILQETIVTNLYYNKKSIDDFVKFHNLDEELKTFNKDETITDFSYSNSNKKNLPITNYS